MLLARLARRHRLMGVISQLHSLDCLPCLKQGLQWVSTSLLQLLALHKDPEGGCSWKFSLHSKTRTWQCCHRATGMGA